MTTDGSGFFGAGRLHSLSADGRVITLGFALAGSDYFAGDITDPTGGTAMVCGGPGVGQSARIVGTSSTTADGTNRTQLHLASSLDEHVVPNSTKLCLVASVGSKIISGNAFSWGMVVQWVGTTIRGVIADNRFTDMNVQQGRGAIMGTGCCYNGPQPVWQAEYTGNQLTRSNGITLYDAVLPDVYPLCNSSTYPGPFTRWQIIRRNTIAGVALSACYHESGYGSCNNSVYLPSSPPCGTINIVWAGVGLGTPADVSTDVVVEKNVFACPSGSVQPPIDVNCSHCKVLA